MARKKSNPFDFFAFQDIITSTAGILIIVTLLLSLSISLAKPQETKDSSEDPHLSALRADLEKRTSAMADIRDLEIKMAQYLQTEVDDQKAIKTPVDAPEGLRQLVLPLEGPISQPLVVVLEGGKVLHKGAVLADMGQPAALPATLRRMLGTKTSVLFLVKPSAFAHYDTLLSLIYPSQLPFGVDLVEEDWTFTN
jgi:hypothetical protein